MDSKLITCKYCGNKIAKTAKICPSCGGKNSKPIYKRAWFIILLIVVVLFVSLKLKKTIDTINLEKMEKNIEYKTESLHDMMVLIEENPMKAQETYKDQYIEIKGIIKKIIVDSSIYVYDSIDIIPVEDKNRLWAAQCDLKTEDQKDVVRNKKIGDIVTVRGKCIDVTTGQYELEVKNIY